MLSQQAILDAVRAGRERGAIDGRDYSRLADFFPVSDWEVFGFGPKEGADIATPPEWTEENIKNQLAKDVAFGFEKALGQRGISASCMYAVVQMWMWVLEDPLQHFDEYAQYGLPLFKAVAVKYELPNEIGDDDGDEGKYACD